MNRLSILLLITVASAWNAGAAPDTWEPLSAVPFDFGVSAGGGLATDGRFIYAADFSGDGNNDFIDLNDNGTADAGETLEDLGIPNGSVRFARYDPDTDAWTSLPTLSPSGVGGDSFSSGDLNRPLFYADGYLYYYQVRPGPYRCVLYRYDLSSAPGGSWQQVWDKSTSEALIDGNAGMVGVETPDGPVILHHRGGGDYNFVRTSALDSGGEHVVLTPDWPFGSAHFPRNGSWEYDAATGNLYHMSGNQLVWWSPSSAYDEASFLTSMPVEGTPLAVFHVAVQSLKDGLGWNPGGSQDNPGASLWGNSLVMVNEPSGVIGGPNGEDTGNHVLYMVRGESSESGWPFNEGRGLVANKNFARYFPDSGATQTLPEPPFFVGKGSGAVYLDGAIYLTQAETRPGPGGTVAHTDGIRIPGTGFARFVLNDGELPPEAHDFSVAWIQRLPVMDWVQGSEHPDVDGWPAPGSQVTWRARIKNWRPSEWQSVGWRCLLDGAEIAQGTVNLAAGGYTDVDIPWTWTFDRHVLRFEIDPADEIEEFSEANNAVETWTDAITVAFWVEQSVYNYFHQYQKDLGIGSNGWEDWAQRQVAHWNEMFAEAKNPIDAPDGVLDRIRLDKITVVPDGALPLNGGLPTNNPDNSDHTTDLVWGFPKTVLNQYTNHTDAVWTNPFYYEGSLLHELGHARYLVDVYGFNVTDREDKHRVLITLDGAYVAGTPYMPRTWQWWDHVFYFSGWNPDSAFQGLMNSNYLKIDRYSAAALNLIAGHRATEGNCNAPGNIGEFLNDLPDANTLQLVDWKGEPIANATVSLYRVTEASGDWYGKTFDDTVDATFTADGLGLVEVGRNPFTEGGDIRHTYGISNTIVILRVDAGGKTGFAFLPSAYFNLEYWRGHTSHGYYEVRVPMIGSTPSIADVVSWPDGEGLRFRIVAGGAEQPVSVHVEGVEAEFREGAWWVRLDHDGTGPFGVSAEWDGGTTINESVPLQVPVPAPRIIATPLPEGLRLQWPSRPGFLYSIEHSDDLQTWSPGADGRVHFGTGAWLEDIDATPPDRKRGFSRIWTTRVNE